MTPKRVDGWIPWHPESGFRGGAIETYIVEPDFETALSELIASEYSSDDHRDSELRHQRIQELKDEGWQIVKVSIEECGSESELRLYKRMYEIRGKALLRPCPQCGRKPAIVEACESPTAPSAADVLAELEEWLRATTMMADERLWPALLDYGVKLREIKSRIEK